MMEKSGSQVAVKKNKKEEKNNKKQNKNRKVFRLCRQTLIIRNRTKTEKVVQLYRQTLITQIKGVLTRQM